MRGCGRRRTPARAGPGRGDPMIAYTTAAETERLTLDQAFARMPDDLPGLRTFAGQRLQTDEQLAEMPAKRLLPASQHLAEAVPALADAVEALP